MSKERPWGNGTPTIVLDATANDSDKSFTVPTGKRWLFTHLFATLSATATVGNRRMMIEITNGASRIYAGPYGPNCAASQIVNYICHPNLPYSTTVSRMTLVGAAANVQVEFTMPEMILTAGCVVHVYDTAAIDAAADDMTVVLHYVEYDA